MSEPCLNARRHLKDGEHDGTEAEHGSLLCRSCYRRLEQAIAELPWYYVSLHLNLARSGSAAEPVSGSREAPVPISLTVVALLGMVHDCDDGESCHTSKCFGPDGCPGHHDPVGADTTPSVMDELYSWVRLILEEDPQLAGPRQVTIDGVSSWLLARLPWLVEQQWVMDFIAALGRLYGYIKAAVGERPVKRQHLSTPCDGCDKRALMWTFSRWYECDPREGGCGKLLSVSEYMDLAKRWAVWAKGQAVAV